MENLWKSIPLVLQQRILYYSITISLNQNILEDIKHKKGKYWNKKNCIARNYTYETFVRHKIRNALLTL